MGVEEEDPWMDWPWSSVSGSVSGFAAARPRHDGGRLSTLLLLYMPFDAGTAGSRLLPG